MNGPDQTQAPIDNNTQGDQGWSVLGVPLDGLRKGLTNLYQGFKTMETPPTGVIEDHTPASWRISDEHRGILKDAFERLIPAGEQQTDAIKALDLAAKLQAGGQTEMDALPPDTGVATEQVADATEAAEPVTLNMDFVPAGQSHTVSAGYGVGRLPMRGNNPVAIKYADEEADRFEGTVGKTLGKAGDFAVYETPEMGFKSAVELMDAHVYRYPEETQGTVAGTIKRHAPYTVDGTVENPGQNAYITGVQATLKAFGQDKPGDKFDPRDIKQHAAFLIGMASVESGYAFPWAKESLIEGMRNATREHDRITPMFSADDILDLYRNLFIVREDGITRITLYGEDVKIGGAGAEAA